MAVMAVAMAAAMAEAKTVADGVAAMLAPTALATMGAGNSGGKQHILCLITSLIGFYFFK
jgi:hypothetical protein